MPTTSSFSEGKLLASVHNKSPDDDLKHEAPPPSNIVECKKKYAITTQGNDNKKPTLHMTHLSPKLAAFLILSTTTDVGSDGEDLVPMTALPLALSQSVVDNGFSGHPSACLSFHSAKISSIATSM